MLFKKRAEIVFRKYTKYDINSFKCIHQEKIYEDAH